MLKLPAQGQVPTASASASVPSRPVEPCDAQSITVTASTQSPNGVPLVAHLHRAVRLIFTLRPGASRCSLSGYPTVDTDGGPLLHAEQIPRGYIGGLPENAGALPVVTLRPGQDAQAIVEALAVDAAGNQCPTSAVLKVTPPGTSQTLTVPEPFDTCRLQVHPVTAQ